VFPAVEREHGFPRVSPHGTSSVPVGETNRVTAPTRGAKARAAIKRGVEPRTSFMGERLSAKKGESD
jgi:hypothetical protein